MQEIDKFAAESVNKILVGNKVDCANRRVATDEAEALGIK
jgi:Ras-related protein Rab-1A